MIRDNDSLNRVKGIHVRFERVEWLKMSYGRVQRKHRHEHTNALRSKEFF